jgi:hypothetical protein
MLRYLTIILCFCFQVSLFAQNNKIDFKKGREIIEYVPENPETFRPIPKNYQANLLKQMAEEGTKRTLSVEKSNASRAQFEITYYGAPDDIKVLFDKAASIWADYLNSDVPIRIAVLWTPLERNVLGSAGASNYVKNFPGATRLNTYYPIALAEKITRVNYNGTDPDIIARFNSSFSQWYKGIEGLPAVNKEYDLLSVILHELGHGLGFIGQFELSSDGSKLGYSTSPGIFDQFIENKTGTKLSDTASYYKNNSTALKNAVTTKNNLYLSGSGMQELNGTRGQLYSPNPFIDGSSIYHVDQETYPVGDVNALMTPQLVPGEVTRNLGPIVKGVFKDMGWYGSSIFAEEATDTEDTGNDFVFEAKLYSDTLVNESSLRLMLAINSSVTTAKEYIPTKVAGTSNTYRYVLPKASQDRLIKYYWTAKNAAGKSFTTPAESPIIPGTNYVMYYDVVIGTDTVKPKLVFKNTLQNVFPSETKITLPPIYANDNIGIQGVYLEYAINGGSMISKTLSLNTTGDLQSYAGVLDFTSNPLKAGDYIKYRIVVKDKAKSVNMVTSPQSDYYLIRVVDYQEPVKEYISSFNSYPYGDFYLKGFSISKPTNFNSNNLHTNHPYEDGSEEAEPGSNGLDLFTNNDAILLKPITIRSDTAKMYFDQVVLVEPGEANQGFYNADGTVNRNFYDYVIVQGSLDKGKSWFDFLEGYDSRLDNTWLNLYNSSFDASGSNSLGVGSYTYYKPMQIDLMKTKKVKAGDQVIIRFRLHADAGANAWGWSIDNLNVQGPKGKKDPILGIENSLESSFLNVFPNPSRGKVKVQLATPFEMKSMQFNLIDLQGKSHLSELIQVNGMNFEREYDVSQLDSGIYIISVQLENKQITRKLIVIK